MIRESSRRKYWTKLVAEQKASGQTARVFCREHGVGEHSFYMWRKRLREERQPVRFALIEQSTAQPQGCGQAMLELLLPGGERLSIQSGVDAATLRTVLAALRA